MTRIALLEFIDEFEAFKVFVWEKKLKIDDFIIVSLEPKLSAHLKLSDVPYRDTLPYFDSDSHRRILVETEKAMEHIRKEFIFVDDNGLKGCYRREFIQYVRLLLNHILRRLEIVNDICKRHDDAQLYAYVYNGLSARPLIDMNERYCGLLAKRFAEGKNIPFFNINADGGFDIRPEKKMRRLRLLERAFFKGLIWFLKGKKVIIVPQVDGPFKKLADGIAEREKDVVFLIIDSRKNLAKSVLFNLLSILRSHLLRSRPPSFVIDIMSLHPLVGDAEKAALLRSVDALTDWNGKGLFTYYGVEYSDMVKQKVDIAVKPHLVRMLSYSHALRYIFVRLQNCLVMSYVGIGIMAVAGEMARTLKKKSLFISHGTHPVPIDAYHHMELNNICRTFMLGDYTHVALCTPVQESHLRYFKDKYREIDNAEIKTGPLIFASVKTADKAASKKDLGISPDSIVVTHAVSIKGRYSERFYFIETLDEFFSALTDIINVVDALGNVRLVIRIHPGFHWSDEEIRALLPASDKYIIHRQGSFSRVLEATDVLISYSSTTIDEALIARIPVLLYDKWGRYNHFKTGVFEDGAAEEGVFPLCYVNNRNKLQSALEFIIRKAGSVKHSDFNVRQYCYGDDYSENFHSFIRQSLQAG